MKLILIKSYYLRIFNYWSYQTISIFWSPNKAFKIRISTFLYFKFNFPSISKVHSFHHKFI